MLCFFLPEYLAYRWSELYYVPRIQKVVIISKVIVSFDDGFGYFGW